MEMQNVGFKILSTARNMDFATETQETNLRKRFDRTLKRFQMRPLQCSNREEEFYLLIEELKLHHGCFWMNLLVRQSLGNLCRC